MGRPKKPRPLGRPKVNKKRQRLASRFLTTCIDEVNLEIREAYGDVTGEDKSWDTFEEVKRRDAEECFKKYNGRCVYCDRLLKYLGKGSVYSAKLAFYVPLNVGGEAKPDNLVVVCAQCKSDHRSTRPIREDVAGIDTFADLCEALFKAVKEGASEVVRDGIKNRLNHRLSDIAACMRYVVRSDWVPERNEVIVEGENTIGERIEQMAEGKAVKEQITQDVKQIVSRKQYKIIRGTDAD